MISNDMTGNLSISSFQPFVSEIVESEPRCIVRSSLFGVSYPEGDMIYLSYIVPKANILPKLGLSGLLYI